jgi:fumarate hydratase class I
MEAINEFEVENMPVIVAVDTDGNAVHTTGPAEWRQRIVTLTTTPAPSTTPRR